MSSCVVISCFKSYVVGKKEECRIELEKGKGVVVNVRENEIDRNDVIVFDTIHEYQVIAKHYTLPLTKLDLCYAVKRCWYMHFSYTMSP